HPAWQWTNARPSRLTLIDNDGVPSSCAGQRACQPRPARRPSSALAISAASMMAVLTSGGLSALLSSLNPELLTKRRGYGFVAVSNLDHVDVAAPCSLIDRTPAHSQNQPKMRPERHRGPGFDFLNRFTQLQ